MRLALDSVTEVPYLKDPNISQFADVKVKSENGTEFRFNKLHLVALMMWSPNNLNPDIHECLNTNQDFTISTNFSCQEIKMICDFVMEGILPCPIDEIFSGEMSRNEVDIFNTFGLDLASILANSQNIEEMEEIIQENETNELKDSHWQNDSENVDDKIESPEMTVLESQETNQTTNLNDNGLLSNVLNNSKPKEDLPIHSKEDAMEKEVQETAHDEKTVIGGEKTVKDKPSFVISKKDRYKTRDLLCIVEIPCGLCGQSFSTFDLMKTHMKTCQKPEKPLINCDLCDEKFKNRKEKLAHKKEVHFNDKLCPECGIACISKIQLQNHRKLLHNISLNKENKGPRIECEECGKSISKYDKKNHFKRWHSTDEKLPCKECNKTFVNEKCLKDHQDSSHIKDICSLCGKLILRITMRHHMERMHSKDQPKQFECEVCKKGFHNYAIYKYHAVIHTGEKPHVCEYCGKGFAQYNNLQGHIKGVHFGIKRPSRRSSNQTNSVQENPTKL